MTCIQSGAEVACQMSSQIWLNGGILPLSEARLSPIDHGVLVGDGVFETLAVRRGNVIAAHEHWLRLCRSCEALGLTAISEAEFSMAMEQVLMANQMSDARLRVTITSGDGPLASQRGRGGQTCFVTAVPLPVWPDAERVCLSPWPLNERGALVGVKSVSYGGNVRSLLNAKAQGCGESLLLNTRDEVCEGTGSNIFLVIDGTLMTPALSSGCLAGVTRLLVLKACVQNDIPCIERAIPVSWLDRCDEAFLTSSTRDVHQIQTLNGRSMSNPGEITLRVRAAYDEWLGKMRIAR